jgi:hypothetical protein
VDNNVTALVTITFSVLVLAVFVRVTYHLFTRGTDSRTSLVSRVASLPRAFREFRAQKLNARETAGWLIVGALMLAVIVVKGWK